MNPDRTKASEVTKNAPYLTGLLRSWRARIFALLPLIFFGCVNPQRNIVTPIEPAPKSAPKPKSLPDKLNLDDVVKRKCSVIRRTVEHLIKNGPRGLDDLSPEELELFQDCEDLRELQEQKGGE